MGRFDGMTATNGATGRENYPRRRPVDRADAARHAQATAKTLERATENESRWEGHRPGSEKSWLGNHMATLGRHLKRLHHRVGWLGTAFLMLPILIWVWIAAREPFISVFNGALPRDVMSGRLFSERFDIGHAGCAMDQPTIGKWLFWFTVMSVSSLSYASVVRWVSDRTSRGGYVAYGLSVVILSTFLLCILSWPACWLTQYVCSMGFTPRRAYGLLYAGVGGLVVILFLCWAFRKANQAVEPSM